MPLNTVIKRNGKTLKVRWGGFHVAAMVCAAAWDSGEGPFTDGNTEPEMMTQATPQGEEVTGHYLGMKDAWELMSYPVIATTPLNSGGYTLEHDYTFVDCSDGEIFPLKKGDELIAFRD